MRLNISDEQAFSEKFFALTSELKDGEMVWIYAKLGMFSIPSIWSVSTPNWRGNPDCLWGIIDASWSNEELGEACKELRAFYLWGIWKERQQGEENALEAYKASLFREQEACKRLLYRINQEIIESDTIVYDEWSDPYTEEDVSEACPSFGENIPNPERCAQAYRDFLKAKRRAFYAKKAAEEYRDVVCGKAAIDTV